MKRRRLLLAALLALISPVFAVVVASYCVSLPAALDEPSRVASLEVVDRGGKLVRRVRTTDGLLASPVRLSELAPGVVPALLAAEDARFYSHPGVDPVAVVRAMGQAVMNGRLVSGASTLTQQLARSLFSRPRTAWGKFREMALALRIERSLSKERILEEYLNRVEFGPNVRGIDAASRYFFDKPPSQLELSEAAALVSLPRGPVLYDPRRGTDKLNRRRDRVLDRMARAGLASAESVERAKTTTLRLAPQLAEGGMEHLALGLARHTVPSGLPDGETYVRLDTTLDAALEREVTVLARRHAEAVRASGASALAVLVLDNATGEALAYVGSPDYFQKDTGGANDGVRALRQPGSTLKPFVYAAAMEDLHMTGATLLPDVEVRFRTTEGDFVPRNYDGRMHGPVRLREALASSLNVPAVVVADRIGPSRVLERLHQAGFASLDRPASFYGAAIALGDGEVRLVELAQAYSMLARGGELLPARFVKSAMAASGRRYVLEPGKPTRAVDARTAAALTDILSDDTARAASFGRNGPLAFDFPVAAKTGTSKGYRDNWTVGYTHEVTVAVWVGNFDGSPMIHSSGVTGAAPLFHDVMEAAMRGQIPAPLSAEDSGLVHAEVCALSGARPGLECVHRTRELFREGEAPTKECAIHVAVRVDPKNGLRAGPACADAVNRVFETYPARFSSWATVAGRPIAPTASSPRCPDNSPSYPTTQVASIRYPGDGSEFVIDPEGHERQEIMLSARAGETTRRVKFVLDGRPLAAVGAPFQLPWRLAAGHHLLTGETDEGASLDSVSFDVRAAD